MKAIRKSRSGDEALAARIDRLECRCLLNAGYLDQSFGDHGIVHFSQENREAAILVRQSDGKLIVAGEGDSAGDGTGANLVLLRYNQDGSVDPSFGDGGVVTTDIAKDQSESV